MLADVYCARCDEIEEEVFSYRTGPPPCACGEARTRLFTGGPRLIGVSPSAPYTVMGEKSIESNAEMRSWEARNPGKKLIEKKSGDFRKLETMIMSDQEKLAARHGKSYGAVREQTRRAHIRRLRNEGG